MDVVSTLISDCKRFFIHLVCGNNEAEKAAMFQEAAVR